VADVLAYVVSCFCIVILIYYAYLGAERSLEVEEVANATTAVLIWPFKLLAVAGLVAFLLQTMMTVVRLLGLAPPSKHDDAAAPIQGEM
jgi:TRAP-type mannitol/chloroaromatic compound transport system permease small subunit